MATMVNSQDKKTTYVAMSGGVDSSVAAALLVQLGFNVVGVFMKPWQFVPDNDDFCLWKQDREDAMRACTVIGIPFETWDFSKEYKKSVTDYMVKEYKAGRTPNPDVMCNKEIKFGLFLKRALKEGADYIATGHYIQKKGKQLIQAKDQNKDQSYFLWTLTPEQVGKSLFPIGGFVKPDVRKLAKKFKLPNHDKKDSQGVCFIGPLDMKEFLLTKIKPKNGDVVLVADENNFSTGKKIGIHDGVYYYTLGQRHGLNIGIGGGPYYVVAKDIKKNIIYVSTSDKAVAREARIGQLSWINKPNLPARLDVKVRYRTKSVKAKLDKMGILIFDKPVRAITPGQSAVFYKGHEMLGGGIIL